VVHLRYVIILNPVKTGAYADYFLNRYEKFFGNVLSGSNADRSEQNQFGISLSKFSGKLFVL